MKCLYLMPVKTKFKLNEHGDEIRYVPCGKCLACKLNRQQALAIRCEEEYKHSACALFLTLTYAPEHLPMIRGYPTLDKVQLQKYIRKVRKELALVNIKMRYVFAGEYGDQGNRPHYHALLFFDGYHKGIKETLASNWPYGFVYCGTVTSKSINYTLKYTLKSELYDKKEKQLKELERQCSSDYRYRELLEQFNNEFEDHFESSLETGQAEQFFGECIFTGTSIEKVSDHGKSSERIGCNGQQEYGMEVLFSEREQLYQVIERPFRLFSSRPGIGFSYGSRINESLDYYVKPGGLKLPLPRYYREKFWTDKHKRQYSKYHEELFKMASQKDTPESVQLSLKRRSETELIFEERQKRKKKLL